MFNFKKYVSAADLSKRVNPEDIPGETVEQKAAYISEYLDREIGEKLAAGEIGIEAAYKLLAETKVTGVSEQFQFLERYRSNIANLLQSAATIKSTLSQTELSKEQISQLIIRKLLERTNQVFIPELVELSRTDKRSTDEVSVILDKLPDYQDPDEITSIKSWISREIQKEIQGIIEEFLEMKDRALRIPNFDENDLRTIVINTPGEALKILFPDRRKTSKNPLPSKFTDPVVIRDVENINDDIQKLIRRTNMKSDMGWTKILSLSNKLSQEEIARWSKLVDHPVEFNLYKILINAGLMSVGTSSTGAEEPVKVKELGFKNPELRSKYYRIFFPAFDPASGLPFISESENRYIQETFGGRDPRTFQYGDDRRMDFIKRSQFREKMNYAKERLYEFITNGYDGPALYKLINSKELSLDEGGLAIQYYFRNICKSNLNRFIADLRDIGLSEHYDSLSAKGMKADPNYEGLRLITRSTEEAKIIQILRNQFYIDAVPYQVLIPVPTDCPTNNNNFDVDFMMYVDTLEYIDPVSFMPVIKPKIMFVGEYFGFDSDKDKTIIDRGVSWVDPDGNIFTPSPRRSSVNGEILKEFEPISPGNKASEGGVYELKTLWKKRTYEAISHIVGADNLYFDEQDIKQPYYTIAQKLDEKDIIYTFSGYKSTNFCKAKKLIDASLDFELKEKLDSPEYQMQQLNDDKNKCLRVIESAILHYKMQKALRQAKKEFIGKSGFDRQTLASHKSYVDGLRANINNGLRIINSPNSSMDQRISAQNMIQQNQSEFNSLNESPLLTFKKRFEEILTDQKHMAILNQFNELKKSIENGSISPDLQKLRIYLLEIDEGVFGFVPDPEQL